MRYLKLLIVFFLIFSCNTEVSKPDNLISKNKLKLVIKDIYLYRQLGSISPSREVPDMVEINNAILQKHGISEEDFESSFRYYVIDGASYGDFLEEVKKELEKEMPLTESLEFNID